MTEVKNVTKSLAEFNCPVKSLVIAELYCINWNIDKVKTEQCDPTEYLDEIQKMWRALRKS